MNKNQSDQEHYYQTIARLLFRLRGAPFVLSAREIDIIEEWEEQHIPLNIISEGIKSAYENFRKLRSGRKKFTLAFSCRFVSNAFCQHRERRVGKKSVGKTKDERIEMIEAEVRNFIKNISKEVSYLKESYLDILDDLSSDDLDEETLERRDDQVERLLLEYATPSIMDKYRQQVINEYNIIQESEKNRIASRKYIKTVREKYKIPYVSLFYY